MLYTDKPLPTVTSWQALKLHHNQRCRRPHLRAGISVVAAAVVAVEGVQGMRYCTVTLLDNLNRCVAVWRCVTAWPASQRLSVWKRKLSSAAATLCTCRSAYSAASVNGHWAKYGIAVFQRCSHLWRRVVHVCNWLVRITIITTQRYRCARSVTRYRRTDKSTTIS